MVLRSIIGWRQRMEEGNAGLGDFELGNWSDYGILRQLKYEIATSLMDRFSSLSGRRAYNWLRFLE